MSFDPAALDYTKGKGLVTVVTQHARTGRVLMVAHADQEALEATLRLGEMVYRSRTRGPWHKGATSGNVQRVVSLAPDCDGDSVLARVEPAGPACHDGGESCFEGAPAEPLGELDRIILARSQTGGGYTGRLLSDRNLRLKKLGEEAAELAVSCADGDRARAVEEAADLVYHALVALRAVGAGLEDLRACLAARAEIPPARR